jgi:hypothetical protein
MPIFLGTDIIMFGHFTSKSLPDRSQSVFSMESEDVCQAFMACQDVERRKVDQTTCMTMP